MRKNKMCLFICFILAIVFISGCVGTKDADILEKIPTVNLPSPLKVEKIEDATLYHQKKYPNIENVTAFIYTSGKAMYNTDTAVQIYVYKLTPGGNVDLENIWKDNKLKYIEGLPNQSQRINFTLNLTGKFTEEVLNINGTPITHFQTITYSTRPDIINRTFVENINDLYYIRQENVIIEIIIDRLSEKATAGIKLMEQLVNNLNKIS